MRQGNRFRYKVILVLILAIGVLLSQITVGTSMAKTGSDEEEGAVTTGPTLSPEPDQDTEPTQPPVPTYTPEPMQTAEPVQSPEPFQTPVLTQTPKPVKTPYPKSLTKVKGVKLLRYATGAVKVTWMKQKKARYYRVYYSKNKSGNFRNAGITKNTHYLVKKLKNNTTYYFYVQACQNKKESATDSAPSTKVHIKTKTYSRKIVFAGDSICQGIEYSGWAYPYMKIPGKKKVVAYRGLNTLTFHTRRIFKGRTGLQKLIAENPYRVYMMLGMNEVHYRKTSDMIAEYKGMIKAIHQSCPNTDIVLCAISPVTRAERERNSGFCQISLFNKKLKKLAKQMKVRYFDYTGFLKDSGGYLRLSYAERDGYHWRMPVYKTFAKVVTEYDRSLDQ